MHLLYTSLQCFVLVLESEKDSYMDWPTLTKSPGLLPKIQMEIWKPGTL
jgi:hypothetical protein